MALRNEDYGFLARFFLALAKSVVVLYLVIDAIFAPIFRPLFRWIIKLGYVIRFQEAVAALPPYAILASLAIPFAFAEPAKLIALYLLAAGHLTSGLVMTALAHLVTLVIVERIYHAGEAKLRTIPWFAKLMDWLIGVRDRLLAWARTTPVWAFAVKVKQITSMAAVKFKRFFAVAGFSESRDASRPPDRLTARGQNPNRDNPASSHEGNSAGSGARSDADR